LITITPRLPVQDGIAATRWLLEQPLAWHHNTSPGLSLLRKYRRQYNETTKAFGDKPVHDFASNCADAARYMAISIRRSLGLVPTISKPETKVETSDREERAMRRIAEQNVIDRQWSQLEQRGEMSDLLGG